MPPAGPAAVVRPPYTRLAADYDGALGRESFLHTRRAFEHLVRRHGVRFSSAADVGCGTGLFARYLRAAWGVPTIGVDRAPAMLARAAASCPDGDVLWLCQDLRRLRLPAPVDLVTANFDTINHLRTPRDLEAALRAIAANLRPGGHLLFDAVTTCRPLGGRRRFVRRYRTRTARLVQHVTWTPARRALSVLLVHQSRASRPLELEVHEERAWAPDELAGALRRAGFLVRAVHDAITLRAATRCPPRLLVLAQRLPAL